MNESSADDVLQFSAEHQPLPGSELTRIKRKFVREWAVGSNQPVLLNDVEEVSEEGREDVIRLANAAIRYWHALREIVRRGTPPQDQGDEFERARWTDLDEVVAFARRALGPNDGI